jgi:hypothetical protein
MKEGCLFVLFVLMRSTESGCSKLHYWSLWKALGGGGVHQLGFMVLGYFHPQMSHPLGHLIIFKL